MSARAKLSREQALSEVISARGSQREARQHDRQDLGELELPEESEDNSNNNSNSHSNNPSLNIHIDTTWRRANVKSGLRILTKDETDGNSSTIASLRTCGSTPRTQRDGSRR